MNASHSTLITFCLILSSYAHCMSTLKAVMVGAVVLQSSLMGVPVGASPESSVTNLVHSLSSECHALTFYCPTTHGQEMVFSSKHLIKGDLPYLGLPSNEQYVTTVIHANLEKTSHQTYPSDERSLLTPINCSSTIPTVFRKGNVETQKRYYFRSDKLSDFTMAHLQFITTRPVQS